MEINTKYLLFQIFCKFCYLLLMKEIFFAVVMWKLIQNIYCARLYVDIATLCCWGQLL